MRIAVMACVLLAGCATEAQIAEHRAHQIYLQNARTNSAEGQADLGCRTKVQFAMAGHQSRTFLDLEGMAKANQMHASCMEYWRRTGQMP